MRKDKAKNVDIVASELIKNPFITQRKLAEKTDLALGTVNSAIQIIEQTWTLQKDERIVHLTNKDLEIVELAQDLIREKLMNKEITDKMNAKDISTVAKDSSARYTIFRGEATDSQWALKAGVVLLPPINDDKSNGA